jgi:hypothetical protein
MTRKTVVELYAQAQSSFADNVTGAITPALLRQFCLDFLDTIRPSYGAISLTSPTGKAATTVYSTFVWETQVAAQAPDYTVSLASGTITRAGGPASGRISFSIDCQAPNNVIASFALFVDGVETPWATSNTSTSSSDIQSYAFSAINYSVNSPVQYDVRVKVNVNNNVTLSNGALVVENVPVNTN